MINTNSAGDSKIIVSNKMGQINKISGGILIGL
jgi:hypothetical protein